MDVESKLILLNSLSEYFVRKEIPVEIDLSQRSLTLDLKSEELGREQLGEIYSILEGISCNYKIISVHNNLLVFVE